MKIHLSNGGHQIGPYSLSQVNTAIADGRIRPAEYMAWYHGCPSWIPLAQVAGVNAVGSMAAGMTAPTPAPVQGDVTGGVIPYKNPQALLSYYFGIFGLVPLLGIPFALAAIILGIVGLKRRKLTPAVRGQVHAWIGMVLGASSLLGHIVVIALIIVAKAK